MADSSSRGSPHRRAYRILGVALAILFAIGLTAAGAREGMPFLGVVMGGFMAFAFLLVFWWLADEHDRRNVSSPGGLIQRGDDHDE